MFINIRHKDKPEDYPQYEAWGSNVPIDRTFLLRLLAELDKLETTPELQNSYRVSVD